MRRRSPLESPFSLGNLPPPMLHTRRSSLKHLAVAGAAVALSRAASAAPPIVNHRIRQSVVPWCFRPMTVPELAKHAAALGFKSVELCGPEHWPLLKELGLTCAIAGSHGFAKGFAQ